jgi:hypothetical protein
MRGIGHWRRGGSGRKEMDFEVEVEVWRDCLQTYGRVVKDFSMMFQSQKEGGTSILGGLESRSDDTPAYSRPASTTDQHVNHLLPIQLSDPDNLVQANKQAKKYTKAMTTASSIDHHRSRGAVESVM